MCLEPTVLSVAGGGSGAGTGQPVWGSSSEDNTTITVHCLIFRVIISIIIFIKYIYSIYIIKSMWASVLSILYFIVVDNIDLCLSETEHKISYIKFNAHGADHLLLL